MLNCALTFTKSWHMNKIKHTCDNTCHSIKLIIVRCVHAKFWIQKQIMSILVKEMQNLSDNQFKCIWKSCSLGALLYISSSSLSSLTVPCLLFFFRSTFVHIRQQLLKVPYLYFVPLFFRSTFVHIWQQLLKVPYLYFVPLFFRSTFVHIQQQLLKVPYLYFVPLFFRSTFVHIQQ